ncbi:Mor transcription activator family protein [Acidovorax sp. SUPP1855]|uniref:Mor transcription activator family protein n=1 Tax=Acidovorax sp. SUPP1855 TaxID=431774 RepID=UPI0024E0E855|nr:Mor transcription activator family protein [Acidovorax sp. SUPP1855]
MSRDNRSSIRRAALLADMVTTTERFLTDNGIPANFALVVANGLADHFALHWGGQVISFPKDHRRELTRLEIEIYERFQGDNYDALAREYDMTMSGIRKLIKRIKAKLASGPQSDLFE